MIRAVDSPMARSVAPFALDDLVGRVDHTLADAAAGGLVEHLLAAGAPFTRRHPADRDTRPQRDLGIPVLTDDETVHVADVHIRAPADEIAKPTGVQHGSGAEDPARLDIDRACPGVGDDVDGVGDEDDHRVRGLLEQLWGERSCHRDIRGGQIQPALARLLLGPGGDDHNGRSGRHVDRVRTGHHAVGHELAAVVEVKDLGPHLFGVRVIEGQRLGRSADQAGVGDGRPDAADPDDGHLVAALLSHVRIIHRSHRRWTCRRASRRKGPSTRRYLGHFVSVRGRGNLPFQACDVGGCPGTPAVWWPAPAGLP